MDPRITISVPRDFLLETIGLDNLTRIANYPNAVYGLNHFYGNRELDTSKVAFDKRAQDMS